MKKRGRRAKKIRGEVAGTPRELHPLMSELQNLYVIRNETGAHYNVAGAESGARKT